MISTPTTRERLSVRLISTLAVMFVLCGLARAQEASRPDRGVMPNGSYSVSDRAEMTKQGDTLVLKGLHMEGGGPGSMGVKELYEFARQLGKEQGVNKVVIEGAMRTTGVNPGSIPRTVTIEVK